MKTSPNTSWLMRMVSIFRPSPKKTNSAKMNEQSQGVDHKKSRGNSKNSNADPKRTQKNLPSHKARESNVDRYKHPSDFSSSNY